METHRFAIAKWIAISHNLWVESKFSSHLLFRVTRCLAIPPLCFFSTTLSSTKLAPTSLSFTRFSRYPIFSMWSPDLGAASLSFARVSLSDLFIFTQCLSSKTPFLLIILYPPPCFCVRVLGWNSTSRRSRCAFTPWLRVGGLHVPLFDFAS